MKLPWAVRFRLQSRVFRFLLYALIAVVVEEALFHEVFHFTLEFSFVARGYQALTSEFGTLEPAAPRTRIVQVANQGPYCANRDYLQSLLPAIADRQPKAIVLDFYLDAQTTCPIDNLLRDTVEKIAKTVPFVVVNTAEQSVVRASIFDPSVAKSVDSTSRLERAISNFSRDIRVARFRWRDLSGAASQMRSLPGAALASAFANDQLPEPTVKAMSASVMGQGALSRFFWGDRDRLFISYLEPSQTSGKWLVPAHGVVPERSTNTVSKQIPDFRNQVVVVGGLDEATIDTPLGARPGHVIQADHIEAALDPDRIYYPVPRFLQVLTSIALWAGFHFIFARFTHGTLISWTKKLLLFGMCSIGAVALLYFVVFLALRSGYYGDFSSFGFVGLMGAFIELFRPEEKPEAFTASAAKVH